MTILPLKVCLTTVRAPDLLNGVMDGAHGFSQLPDGFVIARGRQLPQLLDLASKANEEFESFGLEFR